MTNEIYRRSPDAAWQTIDGETVVLDASGRQLLGLNRVGGRVWCLLDGERTVQEIVALLVTELAQPAERLARDVDAFLAELARNHLTCRA
jgi:hypothetical protein